LWHRFLGDDLIFVCLGGSPPMFFCFLATVATLSHAKPINSGIDDT